MSNMIGIRYATPQGVEGVWHVLRSALRATDETAVAAFLRHWHPEYTYLGQEESGGRQAEGVRVDDAGAAKGDRRAGRKGGAREGDGAPLDGGDGEAGGE